MTDAERIRRAAEAFLPNRPWCLHSRTRDDGSLEVSASPRYERPRVIVGGDGTVTREP